jgi:hypothetical protein
MIVVYRTRVSAASRSGVLPRKILLFPVNTYQVNSYKIVPNCFLPTVTRYFSSSARYVDRNKEVLVLMIST